MSEDNLRASLGADHMQPVETHCPLCREPFEGSDWLAPDDHGVGKCIDAAYYAARESTKTQPAPAPREISMEEAFNLFLALGGLYTDETETARDAFHAGWKAALETRAPQTALEREVQDLRRQMRWMHTSCEPDNCHTSGENCTGGARWTPEDFAPQTAPRDPYKRGQLLP